jgi:hypothetical protein
MGPPEIISGPAEQTDSSATPTATTRPTEINYTGNQ